MTSCTKASACASVRSVFLRFGPLASQVAMSGAGPARRRERFRANVFFGSAFFRAGRRPPMLLPVGPLSVFPPPVGARRPISFEKSFFFRGAAPPFAFAIDVVRLPYWFCAFSAVSGRFRHRAGPSTGVFLQKFSFVALVFFGADCARAASHVRAASGFSGRPAPRAPSERKTPGKNFARVLSLSNARFGSPGR